MYRVEYLVLVDEYNCTSVKTLISLMQSDVDFSISGDKIKFKNFTFNVEVMKGEVAAKREQIYFHLTLSIPDEEQIPQFTEALKRLRKVLAIINKHQIILWDDISKYYSGKANGKIYEIENQMRKLLTKFMFINIGMGWTSDRIPNDVINSVHNTKNDTNYLQNVDFIQLSNFLFSENYPSHREGLVAKLRQAEDLKDLNIEEIKSLLPESNWKRFFGDVVECEAEYLKKRWEQLYDLRCKVAHNNLFTKVDLDNVEKLTSEIGGYLEEAIINLDSVVIPEEEIENIAENVAISRNEYLGQYINFWREFEFNTQLLYRQLKEEKDTKLNSMNSIFLYLVDKDIFERKDYDDLKSILWIRNTIVHGVEMEVSTEDVQNQIEKIIKHTEIIKEHLINTEKSHLEKIKDKDIIALYDDLKKRVLALGNIQLKPNKHYISFVGESNIIDIQIQQKAIKLWINMFKGELKDPKKIMKDVSRIGHLGNGDYEIRLSPKQDLEGVMKLIKQSYNKNSGKN